MSETKFTPGPWILATVPTSIGSCHKIGPFIRFNGDATFAVIYADRLRIGVDEACHDAQVLSANARLIAAAPDLFAACQAMIDWDDREEDHAVDFSARQALCVAAFNLARAALAKVTGERQ